MRVSQMTIEKSYTNPEEVKDLVVVLTFILERLTMNLSRFLLAVGKLLRISLTRT